MKGINRRGQSLVEFAVISLVLYMLLAAILTFGHLLYVAQGLQSAADLAAREISRTPLPAMMTFEDALNSDVVRQRVFDDAWLVIDLNSFYQQHPAGSVFEILVPQMPLLNQQLATLMIVDRPDFDGDGVADEWLLRYPGALLSRTTAIEPPGEQQQYDGAVATAYTVGIPRIIPHSGDSLETIHWVPVVEEIRSRDEAGETVSGPFSIVSAQHGVVALRLNYPFQSASMSSFRRDAAGPFEPTIDQPNVADDGAVTSSDAAPGDLLDAPLLSGGMYAGTYGGRYGLGAQAALGSEPLTGGRPVRPYRRVLSAQAIYRREIFQ